MRLSKLNVVYRQRDHDYLITFLANEQVAFYNEKSRSIFEPLDVTGKDIVTVKRLMADLNYLANKIDNYASAPCKQYMFSVAKDKAGRNIFPLLNSSCYVDYDLFKDEGNFDVTAITVTDCDALNEFWHEEMATTSMRPVISAETLPFEWVDIKSFSMSKVELLFNPRELSNNDYMPEIISEVTEELKGNCTGVAIFIDGICNYSTLAEYPIEKGNTAHLSVVARDSVEHDLLYTFPLLNGTYRYCTAVAKSFRPLRFKPIQPNESDSFDQAEVESMMNSLNKISSEYYQSSLVNSSKHCGYAVDDDQGYIFPLVETIDSNGSDLINYYRDTHVELCQAWLSMNSMIEQNRLTSSMVSERVIKHESASEFHLELPTITTIQPNRSVLNYIVSEVQRRIENNVAIFLDGRCVYSNHDGYDIEPYYQSISDDIYAGNILNLKGVFGFNFLN
ncbi:hypothetical protein [Photobacterium leiognathi]|uniref:hypothetical protein n=1 Tax=Photobacterium leiognathi TaxID=553611 RepID=UPI00298176B7|nr:hypothetical protein [Photobacterium leiognathi]